MAVKSKVSKLFTAGNRAAQQVAGMVDPALRALTRYLVVFAQDRRQLQLLEVVPEKNLGRAGPGAARHGAVDQGRHAAISGTSTA